MGETAVGMLMERWLAAAVYLAAVAAAVLDLGLESASACSWTKTESCCLLEPGLALAGLPTARSGGRQRLLCAPCHWLSLARYIVLVQ